MTRTPELTYQVDLPGGQKRLREAALYVIEKCRNAEWFGLVKLNKMLWRADFEAFATRGQPVTGRQYQRLRYGPAPVEMPSVLNDLKKDGYIEVEVLPVYSYSEHRPRAIVGADLRQFSATTSAISIAASHFILTRLPEKSAAIRMASRGRRAAMAIRCLMSFPDFRMSRSSQL